MDFDEFAFDEVDDHIVPETQIHGVQHSHVPTGIFEPTASSDYGPTDEVENVPFRSKTIRQWLSTPFNKLPKTVLPQESGGSSASAAARGLVETHRKNEDKKRFANRAGSDHPAPPSQPMPPRLFPRKPRTSWSADETTAFYDGLRKFGTDFSLIAVLIPSKTRDLIRLKYKYEEERSPTEIHNALADTKMDIDLADFDARLEVQRNFKSEAVAPLSADEQAMLDEMVSPTKDPNSSVNHTDAVGVRQPMMGDDEDVPLFQLSAPNQPPERTVSDDFAFDAFDETSPIGDQIPISQLPLPPAPKVGRPAAKRVAVKRERATTTTTTTTTTSTLQNSASLQQQVQAFDDFSI